MRRVALAALALVSCVRIKLEGEIQKVRVYGVDEKTTIVVVDFRSTPGSEFMIGDAALEIDTKDGQTLTGVAAAEVDAQRFLEAHPEQGPKYNPSLRNRERLKRGETVDRMLAAQFDVPAADVGARKRLRIRVKEVDGPESVIEEKR
ncbi:MAG: hypothetical protein SFV18_12875 [Bryobacteraceae bacterium]|nr:hypothetical protein [Bryobacteraceae bacterium]